MGISHKPLCTMPCSQPSPPLNPWGLKEVEVWGTACTMPCSQSASPKPPSHGSPQKPGRILVVQCLFPVKCCHVPSDLFHLHWSRSGLGCFSSRWRHLVLSPAVHAPQWVGGPGRLGTRLGDIIHLLSSLVLHGTFFDWPYYL